MIDQSNPREDPIRNPAGACELKPIIGLVVVDHGERARDGTPQTLG